VAKNITCVWHNHFKKHLLCRMKYKYSRTELLSTFTINKSAHWVGVVCKNSVGYGGSVTPLVTIITGLVGAFLRNAKVFCLFLGQFG
jgi:hypothetical protein